MPGKKIVFVGAYIRHVDLRDFGALCRIDMTVSLTKKLAETLGIQDVSAVDSIKATPIPLAVDTMLLDSALLERDAQLKQQISVGPSTIEDWRLFRKDSDGDVTRELRFHLMIPGSSVVQAQDYWQSIHESPGRLQVKTRIEPVQTSIDMEAAADPDPATPVAAAAPPKKRGGRPSTKAAATASVEK